MASAVKRLKGGLVGFGQVAEHAHAPAFNGHPGFSIVAVAEENLQRRQAAQSALPGVRLYGSLEELIAAEKELDFVDIATPPFLHAKQVLDCLDRGIHVLCEKPLTLDLAALGEMEAAARRADRAVYTVDNWKHSPLFLKLRGLLDAGALGPVESIELSTLRQTPAPTAVLGWRTDPAKSGGGILVDHGWHSLYLIRCLLGDKPFQAARRLTRLDASGAERELTAELEFAGARARLHLTWLAASRRNEGRISGRGGEIVIADDHLVLKADGKTERFEFPEKLSQGSAHPLWFKAMLEDFQAEIAGPARGRNLAQSRFCAETIFALYAQDAAAAQASSQ